MIKNGTHAGCADVEFINMMYAPEGETVVKRVITFYLYDVVNTEEDTDNLNNNDGTFSLGNHILDSEILNANHPYRIEKGDFNNDGRMDFIASNIGEPTFSEDIGVYAKGALPVLALSNSDGTYTYSTKSRTAPNNAHLPSTK